MNGESDVAVPTFDGFAHDTLVGAMHDFCTGVRDSNPALLRRAAFTFQSMGGGEQAHACLEAIAPMITGDATFERSLRPLRREVSTRLRTRAHEAQPLTPREYEIALLASQGQRNSDIAARLFLSIRTVESHLYRAMRKLAVERDGLTPALLLQHSDA